MREKTIEQRLVTETRRRKGWALKFVSPGCVGVPDRLILMPKGRAGFVELKAPGKKPRLIQKRRISQLRALGCKVYVVDDAEQIAAVLDDIGGEDG